MLFAQVSDLFRYLSISFGVGCAPHSTSRNQRPGLLHARVVENPGFGAQETARYPPSSGTSDKQRTQNPRPGKTPVFRTVRALRQRVGPLAQFLWRVAEQGDISTAASGC